MQMDGYDNGVPCWVDLGTPDLAAASAFYGGLLGWEVQEGPPEAGGYAMATLRGLNVAGLGPQQNPGPPFWTSYVKVDDADATAAAVTANGGTVIVPPMDVMDAGRMAVFMDPVGAFISVWQPREHIGAQLVNEPGTYSWNELVTDQLNAAKAFYGAVFGWDAVTHGEGPSTYVEFQLGGRSIAGMLPKPEMMPAEVPSYWGVYFTVEDCDLALARAGELGGSTMVPPMDIPQGRFAVVVDPTGAMFNIIALAEGMGS